MKNRLKALLLALTFALATFAAISCGLLTELPDSGNTSESGTAIESETTSESESTSEEAEKFTVRFLNYDDSELSVKEYELGATVEVPTAERPADETYTYEFTGWDKEVVNVTGDATYKAQFNGVFIEYTITFANYDGNVLSSKTYHYDDEVTPPETPEKPADETYTYEFTGWDKEVVNVTGETTYVAQYEPKYIDYEIKFLNYDETVIESKTYHYGDEVILPENDPERPADETYTYEFTGWDKTVAEKVVATDVYVAQYEPKYIDYEIKFLNYDEKVIESKTYHYGDEVTAPENDPERPADDWFEYAFAGWDKEITEVAGDTVYNAVYTPTSKNDDVVVSNVSAKGESLVLNAGSIGDGAGYLTGDTSTGYVHQAYLALDGNYDIDDYVVLDFTGKNMPEIAFFAKNYNDSMYAQSGEQGIVVVSGITTWDGQINTGILAGSTQIDFNSPFMIQNVQDGWFRGGGPATSQLARANLVDGKHYRVIMGFTKYDFAGLKLNWYLYDLDENVVVEQTTANIFTWNFFNGSNTQVNNLSLDTFKGSVVLYGKFGVETALDKVWGVYENTTIADIVSGIGNEYTVTFEDYDGTVLQSGTYEFGKTPTYDEETPERAADDWFKYEFAGWDKEIAKVAGDTVYKAVYTSTLTKEDVTLSDVSVNGDGVILNAGSIGDNANYVAGDTSTGYVHQAYLAFDGNYDTDDYVVLDFTGKNMPEIAFFAKNYNDSMYAQSGEQGIVVVSGITTWDGQINTGILAGSTQIDFNSPFMIQNVQDGWFRGGGPATSQLARANLVDGKHYRVIMGFTKYDFAGLKLNWYLYDLDENVVVEQTTANIFTWNFFNGSNTQVNNLSLDTFKGSVVLYGKFGVETALDKVWGVYENTTIADIVSGIGNEYTVTFKNYDGTVLQSESYAFGDKPVFAGDAPEKAANGWIGYEFAGWDKAITVVVGEAVYTATYTEVSAKENVTLSNVSANGDGVILNAGSIGDGANYVAGDTSTGYVHQAYLAFDGNYDTDDYVVLDFTGKNMPEIAFFAKNYNDSMYAQSGEQGIVVVSGITFWNGTVNPSVLEGSTQIDFNSPFMIQNVQDSWFRSGGPVTSKLARANLVDGKHYRVIMGFTKYDTYGLKLNWYLYDLDENVLVEETTADIFAYNFFTGSNSTVNNLSYDTFNGSIVLYGKFGTNCTIDKIWGVYEDTSIENIVSKMGNE